MKIPVRLKRDPIIECVTEIQFTPTVQIAADLLPGMLFEKLKDVFPNLHRLPTADIPREIRKAAENLALQPSYMMDGPNLRLMMGDRAVSLSFLRPYPGWDKAVPTIRKVANTLSDTGLCQTVDRLSLKYVNLLEVEPDTDHLALLNVEFKLGDFELKNAGRFLRGEIVRDDCTFIVDVKTAAVAQNPQYKFKLEGVLVSVDGIKFGPFDDIWKKFGGHMETLHDLDKEVFFGLVNEETIARMGPRWEE